MVCLALPSCSIIGKGLRKLPWKKKKKEDAAQKEEVTRVIGVIEMVNPEQRFVLVRTQGKITVPPGQEITAMDATGTTTKLKVSPEKKQDFLIADIVDGSPRVGNVVLFKASPKPTTQPDPLQPPLAPPSDPNVQPMPLTPVAPSEFTKTGGQVPPTPSPIPPQPVPSASPPGTTIPEPGQVQLPPIVR